MASRKITSLLIILVIFSLIAPTTFAAEIELEQIPVKDRILLSEQAAYDLIITNNQGINDTFRISYDDISWNVRSDPLYHYFSGVDVASGESKKVKLFLSPLSDLKLGQYKLKLTVKSVKAKKSQTIPLIVAIRPEKPLIEEYLSAVRRIVEFPPVIYPDEEFTVSVNLINRNPKNLTDVKLVFVTDSELFGEEVSTNLEPLETKVIEQKFKIDELTKPQKGILQVKLIISGSVLDPIINEPFEIGAYSEIVITSNNVEKSFLKTIKKTTYQNRGNIESSKTVEEKTNSFANFFTESNPQSFKIIKETGQYRAWQLSLMPSTSVTITTTTNYGPILVLLAILLIFIAILHFAKSPIHLVKRAGILSLREGGISELKIIIHIQNRSDRTYESLTLTDTLPTIAQVEPFNDVGGIKPFSIHSDGARTIVRWEIDKLEKNEERILSYKVKSKLALLGSVKLSPVTLRFYTPKGVKFITKSKSLTVKV